MGFGVGGCSQEAFIIYLAAPSNLQITHLPAKGCGKFQQVLEFTFGDGSGGKSLSQPAPTSPEFQASFYSLRGIRDPWRALPSHEKIISLSHCPVSERAGGNFPWKAYQVHGLCTGLEIFHLSNYFTVACGKGRADFIYWLSIKDQGTVSGA